MNGHEPITIAPAIEGHGEVTALPVLLRRIAAELSVWNLQVAMPLRVPQTQLIGAGLEAVVAAQARRVTGPGGVLVLLDADDHCPADLGPRLQSRAQAARPDVRVGVVLANREFEAWFLAAAKSLGGLRGLPDELEPPADPEAKRDAKGWLSERMVGHPYKPKVDQAPLAAKFDLHAARANSPSFDKLWREVQKLLC
ncbi:DUF4276 family protein [Micromonospora sp. NPDC048999]|uniref:DUF4276 family protein n=1 Tax=Micromonospora sp. NPDC048999 TaxID=3155391 RepID=UPI0033C47F4D